MFLRIESAVRKSVTSVTRWLITPHPADLSRVMHQRLVQEYVPFAAPSLNSHSADKAAVPRVQARVRSTDQCGRLQSLQYQPLREFAYLKPYSLSPHVHQCPDIPKPRLPKIHPIQTSNSFRLALKSSMKSKVILDGRLWIGLTRQISCGTLGAKGRKSIRSW